MLAPASLTTSARTTALAAKAAPLRAGGLREQLTSEGLLAVKQPTLRLDYAPDLALRVTRGSGGVVAELTPLTPVLVLVSCNFTPASVRPRFVVSTPCANPGVLCVFQ